MQMQHKLVVTQDLTLSEGVLLCLWHIFLFPSFVSKTEKESDTLVANFIRCKPNMYLYFSVPAILNNSKLTIKFYLQMKLSSLSTYQFTHESLCCMVQHMCSNQITNNEDGSYALWYMTYHFVKYNKSQWRFMEIVTHIRIYSFTV